MNGAILSKNHSPGRCYFWLGLGLTFLGIAAYMTQFFAAWLKAPWYMPVLSSIGVILLLVSIVQQRSAWRVLSLVMVVLLAGVQWAFMFAFRYPEYTGPAIVGRPVPTFSTLRADGKPFTNEDLKGDRETVMVFFRGRW